MATDSLSAIQFTPHHPMSPIGEYDSVPDVLPLGASTASSAARSTAWRLRRDRSTPPQPYSKETAGSTYRFSDQ